MTEPTGKGETVWENRALKLVIALLGFPVLVLAFHMLLMLPSVFVGLLLLRFGGTPKFWGNALSAVSLLLAGWGAVVVCKQIWPNSK